jgi:two-component system CheB/CheR fusion protein
MALLPDSPGVGLVASSFGSVAAAAASVSRGSIGMDGLETRHQAEYDGAAARAHESLALERGQSAARGRRMSDEPINGDEETSSSPSRGEHGLVELLDFLHQNRGFDFTGYKRASLTRRIRRRMEMVGIDSYPAYLDFLEVHPDEFPQLFNLLLINVTGFFRDHEAWDGLAARLPTIIDVAGETPVRIWSAGCSSGEEPYTLAMILCEALGVDAFTQRVKIYATDVDEDALSHARHATYGVKALEGVPAKLLERYFTRAGSNLVFNKELRRAVIFGRHDLVQDAPIPRIDVLACRNTLMYFNAETQTRILERLQFAVNPNGVLFLGKAEMLLTHTDLFTPVDVKLRVFMRASKAVRRRDKSTDAPSVPAVKDGDVEARRRLQHACFEASPIAQLVLDSGGRIALANQKAHEEFGLSPSHVGRPFHDFELSYRPAELRSYIDKVRREPQTIQLKDIERVLPSGEKTYLDIAIIPLVSEVGAAVLGTKLTFSDVTHVHRLQGDLRRANLELDAAQEELQSTVEELETTNEELQSTVEELETTNEELQSTNEELETMNEELQSTNEELQTMNEELRQRGIELNQINAFYDAVLGSMRCGVAVLDRELRVQTWNDKMVDLWGVRNEEVDGKHFLNLDIGLPIDQVAPSLRSCLASGEASDRVLDCMNRRGKKVACNVSVMPLLGEGTRGVIVMVEEVRS